MTSLFQEYSAPLWHTIAVLFTKLTELIVILYLNLEKRSTLEDLVEVSVGDVNQGYGNALQEQQDIMTRELRHNWQRRAEFGHYNDVKLTFMRAHEERKRRFCKHCGWELNHPGNWTSENTYTPSCKELYNCGLDCHLLEDVSLPEQDGSQLKMTGISPIGVPDVVLILKNQNIEFTLHHSFLNTNYPPSGREFIGTAARRDNTNAGDAAPDPVSGAPIDMARFPNLVHDPEKGTLRYQSTCSRQSQGLFARATVWPVDSIVAPKSKAGAGGPSSSSGSQEEPVDTPMVDIPLRTKSDDEPVLDLQPDANNSRAGPKLSKHEAVLKRRGIGKYAVDKPVREVKAATPLVLFNMDDVLHPKFRRWATGEVLKEFHPFPHLPTEIQIEIWQLVARQPRLIRWGCAPVPPIFHEKYGFYVNFNLDIVYHKTRLSQLTATDLLMECFHFVAFGQPTVGQGTLCPSWCQKLKRLAIPLDDASVLGVRDASSGKETLWYKLMCMFPELEELIVNVYPNLQNDDTINNLVELEAQYDQHRNVVQVLGAMAGEQQNMALTLLAKKRT
ncbi:hypothetical protein G7Y89_g14233 [Cudoniella acicularis]|uniref:2EXR domain-containing protein n=1 Tax=Cudoniella acicularis TaxID=354080 RepID=A0A8H4R4K3_9HELO|nr:hypothetical protein G7Y89_g14233 [Cudoniella acicularis]